VRTILTVIAAALALIFLAHLFGDVGYAGPTTKDCCL
jgi:hypothetical protein